MIHFQQDCGFILVVYPNAETRQWLVDVLEHIGHTVVSEPNLEAAIINFQANHQQLLLVDLSLIEGDTLNHFAQDNPETPIVTVSNDVEMDQVLEGLKNGAIDHFFLIEALLF